MVLNQEETKNKKVFLSVPDAAMYLSVEVSTIYSYLHRRVIPFYKPLRKVYLRIEDLDNFVLNESNLVKSVKQIEEEATQHVSKKDVGGGK